jgi:hypothetical protein
MYNILQRHPVKSSVIHSAGYNPGTKILELEFREGGTWNYFNVSRSAYRSFINAGSLGQYFVRRIKGHYPELKVK